MTKRTLGVSIVALVSILLSPLVANEKTMRVAKTEVPIQIDGKMEESPWATTEERTFDHFYKIEKSSDRQQTRFRMLWDDKTLYVFFECDDQYITARERARDGQPYFDDCAEIFIIPVPAPLDTHLGFEVNLFKASNDFVFFNDYHDNRDTAFKPFDPDFEVEVSYQGSLNNNDDTDKGWTMEMAIPLEAFGTLANFEPMEAGNEWTFLAVRQDRNDPTGNRRSTSTIFPLEDPRQSVHAPENFGRMRFVD